MVGGICPLYLISLQLGTDHQGRPEKPQSYLRVKEKRLNDGMFVYWIQGKNHFKLFEDGRVPFADLLLQEAPTCLEAVQAEHLVFLLLLHGFYSSKHTARKQK
jgi:hypothetical protein